MPTGSCSTCNRIAWTPARASAGCAPSQENGVSYGELTFSTGVACVPRTGCPSQHSLGWSPCAPESAAQTLPRPHAPLREWRRGARSRHTTGAHARELSSPERTNLLPRVEKQIHRHGMRTSQPRCGAYSSFTRTTTLLVPPPGACVAVVAWSVHLVSIRTEPNCHNLYCSACAQQCVSIIRCGAQAKSSRDQTHRLRRVILSTWH